MCENMERWELALSYLKLLEDTADRGAKSDEIAKMRRKYLRNLRRERNRSPGRRN